MGIFDFLTRSSKAPKPEALRERLFDAAAAGDPGALLELCQKHAEQIAQHFPAWRKLPEALRSDPKQIQRYGEGLIAVARCFAERLDRPELLAVLQGGDDNPIDRWQRAIEQADALVKQHQLDEAARILSEQVDAVRTLRGGDAGRMLSLTLAKLAECRFHQGRAAEALAPAREALELCRARGNLADVAACLGTVYELHRYLGQSAEAADAAEQLAAVLDQTGPEERARRFHRLAALARAGEPLNRVVVEVNGQLRELSEVESLRDGTLRFHFARNRRALAPVAALVEHGEVLGSEGKLEAARERFERAAALDPYDPEPRYKLGLTLLYLHRAPEAVEQYQAVEALAPGWYQCRSDLWLARQIAEGKIHEDVLLGLLRLGSAESAEERVAMARNWLKRQPDFAPVHYELGRALRELGELDEARAAYDRGLECVQEPDLKTRLLVDRALLDPEDSPERTRRLGEAVALDGNRLAAAMATLALKGKLS